MTKETEIAIKGKNEVILYQPDNSIQLDVLIEAETVWLTQAQMVMLFDSSKANISEHIRNIYDTYELEKVSTVRNFRTVQKEGNRDVSRNLDYFNLDVIIAIGYRVNTKRGTEFRQWANRILKDYLLRGYAVNQQIEQINNRLSRHDIQLHEQQKQIDFIVRTELPPREGIFYDGQNFDAYAFVSRFLLIDNEVYLFGASFKDLAKKLFGFYKMEQTADEFLQMI